MIKSVQQPIADACPVCGAVLQHAPWVFLDVDERPDIVSQIGTGEFNRYRCDTCSTEFSDDYPLLMFFSGADTPFLFSPAQHDTEEQKRRGAAVAERFARQHFCEEWRGHWLRDGLLAMPRDELIIQIRKGGAKELRNAILLHATTVWLSRMLEVKDSEERGVIEAHPELLAPLGSEVLREWEEQSDNRISRALLRTYRALLTRCRVIGIERAFLQWGLRSEQLAASQADCPPSNWEAATDEKAQAAARFQMDRSRSHIRRGIELASAGRHDEALAEFDLAIEAKPDNPGAHNSRGKLLKMMDRDGEAAKEYTRAIELAPGEAAFRYNRGTLYLKVGRWSRALLDLESALRVDPAWAEARVNLGSCLLNMGRDDEALEEFQTAATMEPGLVQAQWNTALVFLVRGRQDEALPWVRRSAELGVEQAINLLGALEGEHIRDARAGLY